VPDETDIEPVDPDAPPAVRETIGLADPPDDDESDADVVARLEAARAPLCKRCGNPIMERGAKNRPLTYHPDCRPGATHSGMTGDGATPGQTTINVNSAEPTTKRGKAAQKAADLEKVEQNTRMLLEHFVAPMLNMAGQARENPDLVADAVDVQAGAGAIAKATRNLAEHEDWLRKMLAGGEASARTAAWVGFVFAVGPVVLPILARHHWIPDAIASGVAAPTAA
jgi:hypothetical protein